MLEVVLRDVLASVLEFAQVVVPSFAVELAEPTVNCLVVPVYQGFL